MVDARDVLDADARTIRNFEGEIIGHYQRTGPNSWDDYKYVSQPEGAIKVYAGLRIQLERHGPVFRMRSKGRVVRVRWQPSADERQRIGESPRALRAALLSGYVAPFDEAAGLGAAAVIASKLDD